MHPQQVAGFHNRILGQLIFMRILPKYMDDIRIDGIRFVHMGNHSQTTRHRDGGSTNVVGCAIDKPANDIHYIYVPKNKKLDVKSGEVMLDIVCGDYRHILVETVHTFPMEVWWKPQPGETREERFWYNPDDMAYRSTATDRTAA